MTNFQGCRLRAGDYRIIFDNKGNIVNIEKIDNRGQACKGRQPMEDLRSKIVESVAQMDDSEAQSVWNFVMFLKNRRSWDEIPEAEPDEWDKEMLDSIESDPECHEFIPAGEALGKLF